MSERVLYISGRCQHSKKVLLGIQQHMFLKSVFQIINIDTNPYPEFVQSGPCLLVQNQVVTGTRVFEYLGKLVEAKMQQEEREKTQTLTKADEGVCKINEDGLLEGYCGDSGMGIGFSMISEGNDDPTKQVYAMESKYDFLEGSDNSNKVYQQLKQMEKSDDALGQKRKEFDSDLERMQAERGELMKGNGMMGQGSPPMMGR